MKCSFDYRYTKVRNLCASGERHARTGRMNVTSVQVDGEEAAPTKRFWKSFFLKFGISENVFRYFEPAEVFDRISERAADDMVRCCIERDRKGKARLLAVSNPARSLIQYGETTDLVSRYGGRDVSYADGIVTSTHTPRSGDQPFQIGADRFQHRFVMETPVDGFSHPKIYLSYLREICTNGMVGYTRAFRSDVSLGNDIGHCISRALESYDNGEGYAALRQRFESAQTSWASLRECMQLYKALIKVNDRKEVTTDTLARDFHRMTGRLNELYGLANLDAISVKRQRVLPARCRVYDLLNFASEVGTHHSTTEGGRSMQAFIGTMISDEFDMEGTAETVTDFADFLVADKNVGSPTSLN
ncbi:MAG: DUF932 domain-containing protein [Planctomycetes bacterium]|nr:DUF932 domain-containing protein [Planctomycetota bacterium]MBL7040153.1 DUF932 domain-containing protein [Pirellulaceae bacterium]